MFNVRKLRNMFTKKMTGACNLSKKDYLPLSTEAKKGVNRFPSKLPKVVLIWCLASSTCFTSVLLYDLLLFYYYSAVIMRNDPLMYFCLLRTI